MKMLDSDLKLGPMFEPTFHDAQDGYLKGVISTLRSPERGSLRYKMTVMEITVVLWSSLLMCACHVSSRAPQMRTSISACNEI